MDKLKPRFWSSRYSWHSEHVSHQQWTQQSMHGFSSRKYWPLNLVRYTQEYMHEHPNTHSSRAYSVPLTPQAALTHTTRTLVTYVFKRYTLNNLHGIFYVLDETNAR
ncbi:hypothetical protein CDL15_Pgr009433 [Punica granatum]|uniref:Uncharacterized protein n=1 Tax=Punica granatum TaxID=22663 RepID=A0A218WTF2_PUNGR|nr:hypothetical protein CDL15_Pgr009433 [Punica granatum]